MNQDHLVCITDLNERTRQAIEELQSTITSRYPTTTFVLERSPEDPAAIHLLAIADIDDPDEVGDLVVERVVDLQIEGIPLHVIPLRTPEREQTVLATNRLRAAARPDRLARLAG